MGYKEYEMSEQLFLDLWYEYGRPNEIIEKEKINQFLKELVEKSKKLVVLDHYSAINFDYISKIETKGKYTLIHWFDYDELRQKYLSKNLSEGELLEWQMFGCATCEYLLLDIAKLKFILIGTHLFVLLQSALIQPSEIKKHYLSSEDELISEEFMTDELYTLYTFFEGDSTQANKHFCIVSSLPYYSCVIQPKERIPNTYFSKKVLLAVTRDEIAGRMERLKQRIDETEDADGILGIGNIIRSVLEFALKYYCVVNSYKLPSPEQKYGHITLGELRKVLVQSDDIEINFPQSLINTANELSHDSGIMFTKERVKKFHSDASELIASLLNQIKI